MTTDKQLLTAAEIELDNATEALEAIYTTHPAHAALIGQALAALRRADGLLAQVSLAGVR